MARLVQLQINQSGAWRSGLDFDATDLPNEFFDHLDQVLRLAYGDKTTARVVMARTGANGRPVGTHEALMRWSRQEGWVTA
ncbi:MAG: hypothetical protein A2W72_18085 [Burkholderiales bacterium RIFCSPLOWO2_12_67_14]|nr:MAG: hypothetical protein A3I64_07125 [Burkholderiales bacterium RIFCSPLOWO2_02_FULL_67_64]OGB40010.1 MAG: hypothetical protein A3E51_05410 [Burkholderiales bacterium RIFCSPHIGHO2_12_FULL_67_38]OGB49687.1 MAG: hypothetical protein A2W72_18085 [Burkholderiales bacterium RIFCSPLOWO2_12_67_14]OGB87195.1 MAG: hypothetical protein A3G82_19495 [Burkholderiales bacterium RIFCSPLOWO2_12_FULL_67_210]